MFYQSQTSCFQTLYAIYVTSSHCCRVGIMFVFASGDPGSNPGGVGFLVLNAVYLGVWGSLISRGDK